MGWVSQLAGHLFVIKRTAGSPGRFGGRAGLVGPDAALEKLFRDKDPRWTGSSQTGLKPKFKVLGISRAEADTRRSGCWGQ